MFRTWPAMPAALAVDRNGLVYVGFANGDLYAVEAASGRQRWVVAHAGGSPVIDGDGVVYVCAADGLHALDGGTGKLRWACRTPKPATAATIAADGTVYVTCETVLCAIR